jgi:hypothetical protein
MRKGWVYLKLPRHAISDTFQTIFFYIHLIMLYTDGNKGEEQ